MWERFHWTMVLNYNPAHCAVVTIPCAEDRKSRDGAGCYPRALAARCDRVSG